MTERFSLGDFDETIRLVLESGGEFTIWPRGVSMRPYITQGRDSVVLVRPPKKLKKGDIALYRRNSGAYVLHRVISAEGDSLTFCGDNQLTLEHSIGREQVMAVVCRINRKGKSVPVTSLPYRLYVLVWSCFAVRRCWFFARKCRNRLRRLIKKSGK